MSSHILTPAIINMYKLRKIVLLYLTISYANDIHLFDEDTTLLNQNTSCNNETM